jgi:hypothetical protein
VRASDLGQSANDLLEAFKEQLALVPNFTLPGNQYVGAGEIPWDKPGLYVYLGDASTGQPGKPETQNIGSSRGIFYRVSFYVMILRVVATFGYFNDGGVSTAPDAVLNANGTQAVRDAGALLQAAAAIKASDTIVSSQNAGFVVGQLTPLGPQGGMAAMRLLLDFSIEAY